MYITALLVSHDGARWLPSVLAALEQSTVRPDRVVAVDTGSMDESPRLVRDALGVEPLRLPAATTWAGAVRSGLEAADPTAAASRSEEWVWLLHDDARPDPVCLAELVAHAETVGADVAGPKLREWPDLRRLLEIGVTISGTGRRETGLEPGEYDQGQYDHLETEQAREAAAALPGGDDVRRTLAVNSAGMLVRREVLEQVGFDDLFPVLGADLDFGWRAALAGHRTVAVPSAVMYHVGASRRGLRGGELVSRPLRAERAAHLTALLVDGPAPLVAWRAVRLLAGGLLRVLGLLLVRAGSEAREELGALADVYLHPGRILSARRARRGTVRVPRSQVRPLLSPPWLPYRHGLDYLGDVFAAVLDTAREVAAPPGQESGSVRRRVLRSPLLWATTALVLTSLVAHRELLTGGPVHGGALLSPPDGVGHWWSLWARDWHWLGPGTTAPGPGYVLALAVAGTVLLGAAGTLVWLLFLLAVPLAMLSAHRFTRRVVRHRWVALGAAVAYGLLPAVTGAVQQGRLGTVAGALVLPFAATSALGLAATDRRRRSRAVWRTALAAGVLVAFVPAALLMVALLALAWRALVGTGSSPWRGRRHVALVVTVVGVPLLLVLPWAVGTLSTPQGWLLEAGEAGAVPLDPRWWELLLGRLGGPGAAPSWVTAALPVAALGALVGPGARAVAGRAWVVAATAAVVLAVQTVVPLRLPDGTPPLHGYPGFALLCILASFLVAGSAAVEALLPRVAAAPRVLPATVVAVAVAVAVAVPVLGAGWWLAVGSDGPLTRGPATRLPTYMAELATSRTDQAVLMLRGGDGGSAVRYRLLRHGTLRIGDDAVLRATPERVHLTRSLDHLLAGGDTRTAWLLGRYGVRYVYAPPPVSSAVSGAFDAADGFTGASNPVRTSRAWSVAAPVSLDAVDRERSWWQRAGHAGVLAVQVLTLLAVVVLATPGRRERR